MFDHISIIMIIMFSLLALSCIIANGLICYVIITQKTTDGTFKYYIFSMAITDILVGTVAIPTFIITDLQHISWTKKLLNFFKGSDMLLGMCSMFHITLMSFDRMMAISKPLVHRMHMRTRKAALKLLIFPWLLASMVTVFFVARVIPSGKEIAMAAIGITSVFTIICYLLVLITIRKRNEQFSQNSGSSHMINEVRILKMVLCVLGAYLVCWLPFAIVNGTIQQLMSSLEYSKLRYITYAAKFLQYLNSLCNPFVYAIFYPNYRAAVKDVMKRCFHKKETRVHNTEVQPDSLSTTAL